MEGGTHPFRSGLFLLREVRRAVADAAVPSDPQPPVESQVILGVVRGGMDSIVTASTEKLPS